MQDEQWRDIPEFEGYLISSQGRVASRRVDPRGRPLVATPNSTTGYLKVGLYQGSQRKTVDVHTLVAAAFIGPRPDGAYVLHYDGDMYNNVAGNLRYGTPRDNVLDMIRHGRHYLATRTQCKRGHPFNSENTYVAPSGQFRRSCRECSRIRRRRSWPGTKPAAA